MGRVEVAGGMQGECRTQGGRLGVVANIAVLCPPRVQGRATLGEVEDLAAQVLPCRPEVRSLNGVQGRLLRTVELGQRNPAVQLPSVGDPLDAGR